MTAAQTSAILDLVAQVADAVDVYEQDQTPAGYVNLRDELKRLARQLRDEYRAAEGDK